jgi:TolA-binding protein
MWAARADQLTAAPAPANAPDDLARHPARSAQEVLYDDAWDAMRASDFAKAAAGFASVVAVAPAGPLADEGAFWRAVALARAGSRPEAIATFRSMLGAYPASPRRGEASAMLGWLLVDARQLDEAGARFRVAADDPSGAVRRSAREGLDELAAHGRADRAPR